MKCMILHCFYLRNSNTYYIMRNMNSFLEVANISGLMGLGVFAVVSTGLLWHDKEYYRIDWRDYFLLGASGAFLTSWSFFRERY